MSGEMIKQAKGKFRHMQTLTVFGLNDRLWSRAAESGRLCGKIDPFSSPQRSVPEEAREPVGQCVWCQTIFECGSGTIRSWFGWPLGEVARSASHRA